MLATSKRTGVRLAHSQLERVETLFKAFAVPTRLAIPQELKAGPRRERDIVTLIGTSQAGVLKQPRILIESGVVSREKRGDFALCPGHGSGGFRSEPKGLRQTQPGSGTRCQTARFFMRRKHSNLKP